MFLLKRARLRPSLLDLAKKRTFYYNDIRDIFEPDKSNKLLQEINKRLATAGGFTIDGDTLAALIRNKKISIKKDLLKRLEQNISEPAIFINKSTPNLDVKLLHEYKHFQDMKLHPGNVYFKYPGKSAILEYLAQLDALEQLTPQRRRKLPLIYRSPLAQTLAHLKAYRAIKRLYGQGI